MPLNSEALNAACVEIARKTLWKPEYEVQATEAEIDGLAAKYFQDALHYVEFVSVKGSDPNFLVRAARYLAHTHAIPPMRDDVRWFSDMLEVLIELACPNTGLPPQGNEFISDLRHGLSKKLKMSKE